MGIAKLLKKFSVTAVAAMTLGLGHANASHIFFSPVQLNGGALETAAGFTDPTINLTVGQSATFTSRLTGSAFDNFILDFTAGAGSTLTIPDYSILFTSTPFDASYTVTFLTPGVFDGSVFADISGSSPDYIVPLSGEPVETRTFAFAINVTQANAVPEPASIALLGLGLFGIAVSRRKSGESKKS